MIVDLRYAQKYPENLAQAGFLARFGWRVMVRLVRVGLVTAVLLAAGAVLPTPKLDLLSPAPAPALAPAPAPSLTPPPGPGQPVKDPAIQDGTSCCPSA